jgi:hypothetical protein
MHNLLLLGYHSKVYQFTQSANRCTRLAKAGEILLDHAMIHTCCPGLISTRPDFSVGLRYSVQRILNIT